MAHIHYLDSDLPVLFNYLCAAENVTAINPIHNTKVRKLCEAHRRVDGEHVARRPQRARG